MMEIPSISSSSYNSNVWNPNDITDIFGRQGTTGGHQVDFNEMLRQQKQMQAQQNVPPQKPVLMETTPMSTTRIVRVIIADTNDNLPLDKRILYSGDEKLTDLTDQELFFELNMADLLAKHNSVRIQTKDKKDKDGGMLPPARIRDLKMIVIDIAKF